MASAHHMIDASNLSAVKNHLAWLPFHFLPGNAGQEATDKLVCKPDSPVAREMLRLAMQDQHSAWALHRLGITMHVYADTFAHQGFVGALSEANQANNVTSGNADVDQRIRDASKKGLWDEFKRKAGAGLQLVWTSIKLAFKERESLVTYWHDFFKKAPLGHAAVDSFPDQPHLVWRYTDWKGQTVQRNNPQTYMDAFDHMVRAMQAWLACDASMDLSRYAGLPPNDAAVMLRLFTTLTDPVGENRHAQWCEAIARGDFSFGAVQLHYPIEGKGPGSWKDSALSNIKTQDNGMERYPYSPTFLSSNWKLFHDAAQAHRHDVVHRLLPLYGICAA